MRRCNTLKIKHVLNILTGCALWGMIFWGGSATAATISAGTATQELSIAHGSSAINDNLMYYASCTSTQKDSKARWKGKALFNAYGVQDFTRDIDVVCDSSEVELIAFTGLRLMSTEGVITTNSESPGTYTATIRNARAGFSDVRANYTPTKVCSIDVNTSPTIPVLHPASDVDITGIISNPVGAATVTFKPGRLSGEMQKGIITLNNDGRVNGYYAINNKPVDSNGEWVVGSDSNPFLHVRSVKDANAGKMTGFMTATIACP